jgi:hypothetical protein
MKKLIYDSLEPLREVRSPLARVLIVVGILLFGLILSIEF